MNNAITELGYLGFEVSNLGQWDKFATDVLGMATSQGSNAASRWLRMDEQRNRIILTEGPADDHAFAGWRVANAAAVEAFGRSLTSKGIAWTWGNNDELALRAVQHMLHFTDPTGTRHEVFSGPLLAADRFGSSKVASGFVTGDGGMGHVVYQSSDYPKTVAFAQDVLGFAMSDTITAQAGPLPEMRIEVSFMHTNERHHSFAVAPQPPIPGQKRLHHFMVEACSVEEVGFARDRCLAMGLPVVQDIGQHPNDRMISFYGVTPSGFLVEFGWGGVKVDQNNWQVATYDKFSEWGHRPAAAI
jgi:2,3-dihydroxybiphenyl 1,2-dioxygenase